MRWVSAAVPRARPYASHLWSALASSDHEHGSAARRAFHQKRWVFKRRVSFAMRWLQAWVKNRERFKSTVSVATPFTTDLHTIVSNASSFGFGAVLHNAQGKPTAYWADGLATWDLVRCKARRGDPAWQAAWGLLAVLFSLIAFSPVLSKAIVSYSVSDGLSLGLGVVRRLRSSSPVMAAIAAEISLCLEGLHSDLREAEHIIGVDTVVAAALS